MYVMVIFDVIIILFGAYMVISSFYMKKSGEISSMLLAKEDAVRCKDRKGFLQFIYWREMLFGAVTVIVGILGIINNLIISLGNINTITMLVFLIAFIWFEHELGSAREKFLH